MAHPRQATAATGRTRTLDGLRGIAVLAVVVDHAWPRVLPGGFAGVDIFFVLSGFLITRILVGELRATGRIDLVGFYARRVRRIVPAALLCVVGTWLGFVALLGSAVPDTLHTEAAAAGLSVSNILFARSATDYFAATASASPYLHFWSLAVEEQFYLVWPALLLIVAFVAGRLRGRFAWRWVAMALLAVMGIVSVALMLRARQTSAFYLLPYRGWELIVGGLLAWIQLDGVPARLAPVVRYRTLGVALGAAALVLTFAAAPALGRWPGPATILAVAGTGLLVAAGDGMVGARLLGSRILRAFGRISYALYLWHWPLLAASALSALPGQASTRSTVIAVLLAVGIATVSTVLIEEPIRGARTRLLIRRPAIGVALGSMVSVALVVTVLTVPLGAVASAGSPIGDALATARTDRERIIADGCYLTQDTTAPSPSCVYGSAAKPDGTPVRGEPNTTRVAILFGDSHAMHWFPILDTWAREAGLALVPLVRLGCAPEDAMVAGSKAHRTACSRWLTASLARIAALKPAITIVSMSTAAQLLDGGATVSPRATPERWIQPAARMFAKIRERSATVLFIGDVPRPSFSVPDCLGVHRQDPAACGGPLTTADPVVLMAAEQAAATQAGVSFVDPGPWLCPDGRCTWLVGGRVGWVDTHHLSSSAALWVGPELRPVLDRVAGGAVAIAVRAGSWLDRVPSTAMYQRLTLHPPGLALSGFVLP